jgi:gliding motility-associated-like protein
VVFLIGFIRLTLFEQTFTMKKNYVAGIKSFIFLMIVFNSNAQLITNPNLTPAQLVKILVGNSNSVVISNITNSWEDSLDFRPVGSFIGIGTNIGLDSGIILTTGTVDTADVNGPKGPNDNGGATVMGYGDILGTSSNDQDLKDIAGIPDIYDAAILEFNFVPCADTVKFRYVFGSEEYPEYVCSPYNDAFGFILSGGITNPISHVNLAKIPGTTTPVTINSVNGGAVGSAGFAGLCGGIGDPGLNNSAYYVDNATGTTIQYDGFTKVLTAMSPVVAGETYHIKIAIGDVSDGLLDSGVFLEAGSFKSTPFPIDLTVDRDTICTDQKVVLTNNANTSSTLTHAWDFGGANVLSGSGKGPYELRWDTPGLKKIKASLNACTLVSDSIYVFVTNDCKIETPNIFTPNSDDKNERFAFKGLADFPNSKLIIYNRWGNLVYENSNYTNDWTGSDVSDGVYFYVLEVSNGDKYNGYVTILRKS